MSKIILSIANMREKMSYATIWKKAGCHVKKDIVIRKWCWDIWLKSFWKKKRFRNLSLSSKDLAYCKMEFLIKIYSKDFQKNTRNIKFWKI